MSERQRHCRECGEYLMRGGVEPWSGEPGPGSISFCLHCGSISIFTPDMRLRAPVEADRVIARLSERTAELRERVFGPSGNT